MKISDGDYAIVIRGSNKGHPVLVINAVLSMAYVYFPLNHTQKTLQISLFDNMNPRIKGPAAFEKLKTHRFFSGYTKSAEDDLTAVSPGTPSVPVAQSLKPVAKILSPSVDAASVALCDVLDAAHMSVDDFFIELMNS